MALDYLLQETGDKVNLEYGSGSILLQSSTPATGTAVLAENVSVGYIYGANPSDGPIILVGG